MSLVLLWRRGILEVLIPPFLLMSLSSVFLKGLPGDPGYPGEPGRDGEKVRILKRLGNCFYSDEHNSFHPSYK